jgi:hypothetical protein
MTPLGKIFAVLVFIIAVVSAYFTVSAYATRTNYVAQVESYKKSHDESEKARKEEVRRFQFELEVRDRIIAAEKSRADDLAKGLKNLTDNAQTNDKAYRNIEIQILNLDMKRQTADANAKIAQDESETLRKRNNDLEVEKQQLIFARRNAESAAVAAINDANKERNLASDLAQKVESLLVQVNELKATGGSATAAVLRAIDKQPPPLPENIRGTVERVEGDLVHISIGIDAGLSPGSRLDIYRENGGGQYLGTLVVTSTLFPKAGVARFYPARPVPLAQLRIDELPKRGDIVGHVSTGNR